MDNEGQFNWLQENRRWLWIAVIGLWAMGCVILVLGGGWWLGQRSSTEHENESVALVEPTTAEIVLSTPMLSTDIPAPSNTATPQPTVIRTETSAPSLGDRLSLPTATSTPFPEGVIVFLSSRDHDGETGNAFGTALEIYAMKTNGDNQIQLSNIGLNTKTNILNFYYKPGVVAILEPYINVENDKVNVWTAGTQKIFDPMVGQFVDEVTLIGLTQDG